MRGFPSVRFASLSIEDKQIAAVAQEAGSAGRAGSRVAFDPKAHGGSETGRPIRRLALTCVREHDRTRRPLPPMRRRATQAGSSGGYGRTRGVTAALRPRT
jgi:hypothetical protein